jgi:hypothetical protein
VAAADAGLEAEGIQQAADLEESEVRVGVP